MSLFVEKERKQVFAGQFWHGQVPSFLLCECRVWCDSGGPQANLHAWPAEEAGSLKSVAWKLVIPLGHYVVKDGDEWHVLAPSEFEDKYEKA